MRRLGEELGFEAMSLYRYVANKKDLLDGMLDLVLAEWEQPDTGASGRRRSGRARSPCTTRSAGTRGPRACS